MNETKICLKCGTKVEEDMMFCPQCGNSDFENIHSSNLTVLSDNDLFNRGTSNNSMIDNSISGNNMNDYLNNNSTYNSMSNNGMSDSNRVNNDSILKTEYIPNTENKNIMANNGVSGVYNQGQNVQGQYNQQPMNNNNNINSSEQTKKNPGNLMTTNIAVAAVVALLILVGVINAFNSKKQEQKIVKNENDIKNEKNIGDSEEKSDTKDNEEDEVSTEDNSSIEDKSDSTQENTKSKNDNNNQTTNNNQNETLVGSQSSTPFNKGSVSGNYYVNSWLGIKVPFPDGYSQVDNSKYNQYSNSENECVLCLENSDGNSIVLMISEEIEEDTTIEELLKELDNGLLASGQETGYTKINQEYVTGGGLKFIAGHYKIKANELNNIAQSYYFAKKDKRFITIIQSSIIGNFLSHNFFIDDFQKIK